MAPPHDTAASTLGRVGGGELNLFLPSARCRNRERTTPSLESRDPHPSQQPTRRPVTTGGERYAATATPAQAHPTHDQVALGRPKVPREGGDTIACASPLRRFPYSPMPASSRLGFSSPFGARNAAIHSFCFQAPAHSLVLLFVRERGPPGGARRSTAAAPTSSPFCMLHVALQPFHLVACCSISHGKPPRH